MASVISLAFMLAATLLVVATAFPSEKLPFNAGPGPKGVAPPPRQGLGPKGLVGPRPERSAAGGDLSPAESHGFGYGYGWGYPYGSYGWGWGGYGYPYAYGGYPYGGYYGYPYSYGSPWGYDWWWW